MAIFYDTLIALFLIGGGLMVYFLRRCRILRVLVMLAIVVVLYGSFIEPQIIVVTRRRIDLAATTAHTVRAVLISDLHVGPYKQKIFVRDVVEKINATAPDVVLIAGDHVYEEAWEAVFLEPLKNLRAPLGVFAITGNHDYGIKFLNGEKVENDEQAQRIKASLLALGINVLINQGVTLHKNGGALNILGVDEWWTARAHIAKARSTLTSPQAPTVLLTHNPDIIQYVRDKNIDLVLAGHTHGGQIRLPFIGPVPEIPDQLGRTYDEGFFEDFAPTKLFITRGVGEMGPRARLFAWPEIAVLEIGI